MKKLIVFTLSVALLLSAFSLDAAETTAASGKTHKVEVSLSGAKSVRVKSGKKNVNKKTITVQKGDNISFSHAKNKKIKSIAYKSTNKKVVTITKKGKAAAKKAGTAKIRITVKQKKRKEISTWVEIKVKRKKETGASLTTNGGAVIPLSALEHRTEAKGAPVVYYTSDITQKSLIEAYRALGWTPEGKVAVKLSTGEPPASNYLDPNLIKDLVQLVKGTIVECNTVYGGDRSSTAMHYQVAKDHGFTEIADFQILDEDGSMSIPVKKGSRLKKNYVGKAFGDYDSYLVLSHFKGHSMAGFGGAIKNISIGLGSSEGKAWIHSGGTSRTNPWGGEQDRFLEAMGDAGKAVSDYLSNGGNIVYINVMNRLSIDCDCNGNPVEPDMHDIGILASADPVALDQACIDLVWVSEGNQSFINRVEDRNGLHTLENAEDIGLGSRTYQLIDIGK